MKHISSKLIAFNMADTTPKLHVPYDRGPVIRFWLFTVLCLVLLLVGVMV